jgi:uncharacterized membrane protein YfcA
MNFSDEKTRRKLAVWIYVAAALGALGLAAVCLFLSPRAYKTVYDWIGPVVVAVFLLHMLWGRRLIAESIEEPPPPMNRAARRATAKQTRAKAGKPAARRHS